MAVPGTRISPSALAVLSALGLAMTSGASAREASIRLPNAQVAPLEFAAMPGWADDDHAAAFNAYLKSCGAILQGSKIMRIGRPLFGGLFNACERAKAAGQLDRDQARAFFEANFKPVRIAPS